MNKPILFRGTMVNAILSDAKTQTRRLVKDEQKPYAKVGDVLWVRESFRIDRALDDVSPNQAFTMAFERGQDPPIRRFEADGYLDGTPRENAFIFHSGKLRPGIHMPEWMCRLRLLVTAVRSERLIDITDEDAIAEGVLTLDSLSTLNKFLDSLNTLNKLVPSVGFQRLWKSIHGEHSWNPNTRVWVVSFKRVTS